MDSPSHNIEIEEGMATLRRRVADRFAGSRDALIALIVLARIEGTPAGELPSRLADARDAGLIAEERTVGHRSVGQMIDAGTESLASIMNQTND